MEASPPPHDADECSSGVEAHVEENGKVPPLASAEVSTAGKFLSPVPRKVLPPVPKFNSSNFPSMGPPPSRPKVMGPPPPVPKFHTLAGDTKEMSPPPPGVVSTKSDSSSEESDVLSVAGKNLEVAAGTGEFSGTYAGAGLSLDAPIMGAALLDNSAVKSVAEDGSKRSVQSSAASSAAVVNSSQPYVKPSWSSPPGQSYTLEILKEGIILDIVDVSEKGAYMFGRSDACDFVLEHPTISRYHAVLQYNSMGESFLYDVGSTHGTYINKRKVKEKLYIPLRVGDIIRFGHSSRLHLFQGPLSLMPKEGLSKKKGEAQILVEAAQDRAIREASLNRAKRDASAADGISWGMQEDAEEEEEEENKEEVTWQTFKGELTEKQQKTLEKIHKRKEKLSNLKKENDAIQAKESSQGGLTQGQQTQMARNDQRMEQIMEELESMEDSLNESIQESINGRSRKGRGWKRKLPENEDEDEDLSEDEFYDRASKVQSQRKREAVQVVETAQTLLDKKAALTKEIENLRKAIKAEAQNLTSNHETAVAKTEVQSEDPLDQFMTNLSSKIVEDRTSHLQKELNVLIKEVERVGRLLKIADPTGEAFEKWEGSMKSVQSNHSPETLSSNIHRRVFPSKEDAHELATTVALVKDRFERNVSQDSILDASESNVISESNPPSVEHTAVLPGLEPPARLEAAIVEHNAVLPGLEPPVRLGAPIAEEPEEIKFESSEKECDGPVDFITYKDRKKAKVGLDRSMVEYVMHKGQSETVDHKNEEPSRVDLHIADSVALLLRHKRGLVAADVDVSRQNVQDTSSASVEEKAPSRQSSKKRKKQGPGAGLSHFMDTSNNEDWAPPPGQTGDGRTALNDKYGY